jgi:hypothetical protein
MSDKYIVVKNTFEYDYKEQVITTDDYEAEIDNKIYNFDTGKKVIQEEYNALYEQTELKDEPETEEDKIRTKEMDELEGILNDGDDLPGNFVFRGKDKIYQWYLFELEEDTDEEDQTDSGNKE